MRQSTLPSHAAACGDGKLVGGGKMRHLSIWLIASFVAVNIISGYVNGGVVVAGIRTISERQPMAKIVHLPIAKERTAALKVHE